MTEPIAVDPPKPAFSRTAPAGGPSAPVAVSTPAPKVEAPKAEPSKLEAVLSALAPAVAPVPAPAPSAPPADVPLIAGFTARHLKMGAIALASIVAGVGSVRMMFPSKGAPEPTPNVAANTPLEKPKDGPGALPPPKMQLEPEKSQFDSNGGPIIPMLPAGGPAPLPVNTNARTPEVPAPSGGSLFIPVPPTGPGVAPPSPEPLVPSPAPLIPVGAMEPPKLPIPTAPGGPATPTPPTGTGGPVVPALPPLPAAPGGTGGMSTPPVVPPVAPPSDLVPPVAPPSGLVPPVAPPSGLVPPVAPPTGMGTGTPPAPTLPPIGTGPAIPPVPPPGSLDTPPKPAPLDPPGTLPMVTAPKVEPPKFEPPKPEPSPFAPVGTPPAGGTGTGTPAAFTKPGGSSDAKPLVPELAPRTSFDVELYDPRQGDTYDSISKEFYNDARFAKALEAFNRARNPNGTRTVEVPPLHVLRKQFPQLMGGALAPSAVSPASGTGGTGSGGTFPPPPAAGTGGVWNRAGEPPAPATPVRNTYRVPAGGTTPREIARTILGSEQKWRDIYDLNDGMLPDRLLPAGTEVKLP